MVVKVLGPCSPALLDKLALSWSKVRAASAPKGVWCHRQQLTCPSSLFLIFLLFRFALFKDEHILSPCSEFGLLLKPILLLLIQVLKQFLEFFLEYSTIMFTYFFLFIYLITVAYEEYSNTGKWQWTLLTNTEIMRFLLLTSFRLGNWLSSIKIHELWILRFCKCSVLVGTLHGQKSDHQLACYPMKGKDKIIYRIIYFFHS